MQSEPNGLRRICAVLGRAGARLVVISLLFATAASAESKFERAHGRCEVEFFATSTKRDFSGKALARPFMLTRHQAPTGGSDWWSASVELAVTDLITGYDERDKDMYWMFESTEFPSIFAEFPHIDSELSESVDGPATLAFRLTIRDVTKSMTAKVSHWVRRGDDASFDAEFEVSTSSFELKVPTLLGFLRVGDTIKIRAHIEVARSAGTRG